MKAAGIRELKKELNTLSQKELVEVCLKVSKFKKENKELLSYLLFEASDEQAYIESVKSDIDEQFKEIRWHSYYYANKGVRKILRILKKYIRYSKLKETEVALLIHFCKHLKNQGMGRNKTLENIYDRQLTLIQKSIEKLHEDLQFDYQQDLEELG